jgi:hypothetical protein
MRLLRLSVISGVLLLALATTTSALAQASGTWAATGSMPTTAGGAPATLLHTARSCWLASAGPGRRARSCTTRPRGLGPPPAA